MLLQESFSRIAAIHAIAKSQPIPMDEALTQLYLEGKIDQEMVVQFAQDPVGMIQKLGLKGVQAPL